MLCGKNPSASSVRVCKPLKLEFKKETAQTIKDQEAACRKESENLKPTTVPVNDKKFIIHHKVEFTMLDRKARAHLTNTLSFSNCPVCGAKPVQMKDSDKFPVNPSAIQYGLSPLHARIRFLECILHLSYRIHIKRWSVNANLIKDRKLEVQTNIKETLGILVDVVKQGSGNTNCGNTSRRFFEDPEKAAAATGVDRNLIERFSVILSTINSGYLIDIEKFRLYAKETRKLYESLYPWFYMPAGVHLVLAHGADIMDCFELPIGMYSEEALESRNEDIRNYREHHTRKISKTASMQDLFCRLLLSGDILMSSGHFKEIKNHPRELEKIFPLLKFD